jgi:hypothetical protein
MAQQPMTVDQMIHAYQQITADYRAKRIDKAGYAAALTRLKAVDAEKRWWSCTPEGQFTWYDGSRWVPGQPALRTGQTPGKAAPAPAGGSHAPVLNKSPQRKGWRRLASTPILAMLPGAVIGGLWSCYTLFQLILGEPKGVDFLTPAILSGVPLLLWLLRRPLDKLLLPLQKFQSSFPFALRLGIVLALPMLVGCGCSTFSTSGYSALHLTAFCSTLFGYFVLHTPVTHKDK